MGALLYMQKTEADRQIAELKNNASQMQETISDLQGKIDTISNTINGNKLDNNTEDKTTEQIGNESIFDDTSKLEYTNNWKDDINGKIAILKMGEGVFKTKIENDYYTYIDNFSNSYQIKNITEITSKFYMMGIDDWAALYKCNINYIDNKGTKKEIVVAVIVPTDNKDAYISAPFDNYTGSTSFVRSFAENVEE